MGTRLKVFLGLINLVFFILFLIKATVNMYTIPFHDFDEAHRAENAKRMREYKSYLVPITGSSQDRSLDLKIPFKEYSNLYLYYHPERPPLVYLLMIGSTSAFGSSEWAYRLPSLILGALTILTLLVFSLFILKDKLFVPALIATLLLVTSTDLWLSSQYAQLDTGLTFFLTVSLLSIILYCEKRKNWMIIASGISFALAILSKGQPAVIFIFPLAYLLFSKKLPWKKFIHFLGYAAIIILPWFFLLEIYFGLGRVLLAFTEFAATSALVEYSHIEAPIFWYARWWWDSLRPGWVIFLALFLTDLYEKRLNWKKKALLSYILGGFIFFSLSVNKIWWYVLPIIPAIALYTYFSLKDLLKRDLRQLINLSFVIILASLPIFLGARNIVAVLYGMGITLLSIFILKKDFNQVTPFLKFKEAIFLFTIFLSLVLFFIRFPKIEPYNPNIKEVAVYFKNLPEKKCLWNLNMSAESALFYSDAGEVVYFSPNSELVPGCKHYLIAPEDPRLGQVIFKKGEIHLIKIDPSLRFVP